MNSWSVGYAFSVDVVVASPLSMRNGSKPNAIASGYAFLNGYHV